MTLPRRTRTAAAIAAPVLAMSMLVPTAAQAAPAPETDPAAAGEQLLDRIGADTSATTADGAVWDAEATGFASTETEELPDGTVGGLGGETVTVTTAAQLIEAAAGDEPRTILVKGSLSMQNGDMITVGANKTIAGVGGGAELVDGGLFVDKTENVIIRNLTFRDSYVPGDWDGKLDDNDNDGIRVDTSDHVWIDHNDFTRIGDGMTDLRKDSTNLTVSWNSYRDHNKAIGVGWTKNVVTTLTMHHNLISNTYQRNASLDNLQYGHLYNNVVEGIGQYGTMSRGASQILVENSVYAHGEDALVAKDEASQLTSRGNKFTDIRGYKDNTGPSFEASDFYDYGLDDTNEVEDIVKEYSGSVGAPENIGRTVTVALDGTGDFGSVGAALGAAWRVDHPVDIVIEPGTYHEVVRIFPGMENVTLRGSTGNAEDVVIDYNLAAGQKKFYGTKTFGHTGSPTLSIMADDVTLEDLSVSNSYDEATNGNSQALALRTAGDRAELDNVRLLGNQDTYLADPGSDEVANRTWIHDSYIEGDVDFIYGGGTLVVEDSEIHSLDRGAEEGQTNGYVAAPATVPEGKGFLFTDSEFTSDARAGSVYLGRPWHPSSNPNVAPSMLVRDSVLGEHIGTPAWTDMSGWSWEEDDFSEFDNVGPGAAPADEVVEGRPQLSETEAADRTREDYLAGTDGWTPRKN